MEVPYWKETGLLWNPFAGRWQAKKLYFLLVVFTLLSFVDDMAIL